MRAITCSFLLAALFAFAMQGPAPAAAQPGVQVRGVQPIGAEPLEVLDAEKSLAGADVLLPLARADDPEVRSAAVRALGRLEQPNLVATLLGLENVSTRARADAIAQSLKGFDAASNTRLVQIALEWMLRTGSRPIDVKALPQIAPVLMPLSRIAYSVPQQVHDVERLLLDVVNLTNLDAQLRVFYVEAARSFESLARLNSRLTPLHKDTAPLLARMVRHTSTNDVPEVRLYALLALVAGRSVDGDVIQSALKDEDWQVRRVALTVLAGTGAGLDQAAGLRLIGEGLTDRVPQVRLEALRAYARHGAPANGCQPIVSLIDDRDRHVSLAAIDALGDSCREDDGVTRRLMAEGRVPRAVGSWHRETHAFVALARRAPGSAALRMDAFARHPLWWVRMYAAAAAAAAGDVIHLENLAYDANDNVREASLGPLRRSRTGGADAAIVAALGRSDVQLLRTAAILLKESPRNPRLFSPLAGALQRLTKEGKETSRDARLALLDAVAVHADAGSAADVMPLLKDFDPKVAGKAAQVVSSLTGTAVRAEPAPHGRGWPQEFTNLRQCVVVRLDTGGSFRMQMAPDVAPIAVDRFLKLATKDHYYDGLSIHRVVPNFVIQGGSPGANEYSGHREFMRDEVSGRNVRGSVGLSTRGRNTGDAQFFVNLVDNPRLDYDYTVFANVPDADMGAIDRIQEGDVMRSVSLGCGSK